jgi:isopentenyl-diphosphate Delta-isomerase
MNIVVVNEKDEVVGVKERSLMDYSSDIYRSSGLWLTNSKGQVLLSKRSNRKDKDPGLWAHSVGGTVDEGETYRDNVYKEAAEEIGLRGVAFTKGPKVFYEVPRRYFCQWYYARVDWGIDKFIRQVEEVDQLKWEDVDTLKQDLKLHPDKYIPSMPRTLKELQL